MEKVSKEYFRNNINEVFEKVKNGKSVVITDNGQILARLTPNLSNEGLKETFLQNLLSSKKEFDAAMSQIDEMYLNNEISIDDCYLSKGEPIDMGYTDSSNLDLEIYK